MCVQNEKDNELTTLSVGRRVYVCRDEQRQVASVMLHCDTNHLIRVGGLIFLSPGHLLPHQLAAFHTPNYIYPIGYKIVRYTYICLFHLLLLYNSTISLKLNLVFAGGNFTRSCRFTEKLILAILVNLPVGALIINVLKYLL